MGKEYPTKPIELLCPFTPGSTMDLYSRLIADRAQRYLGQPMVVVNKPGAAGAMAAADIITSKHDGYKLAVMPTSFFSIAAKTQKLPFDPSHVVPLATFVEYITGLQVKGDSPWQTLNDLLDYGKKNPEKIKWGHPGRGTTGHLKQLLIFKKAGVSAIDIPYKGNPEQIAALLGGHIDAIIVPFGAIADHIQARKARYLVAYSDSRYSCLPDVPCAKELGFPEITNLGPLVGVFAHKDTPAEVKKILFDVFKKIYEDPEFKKEVEKIGDEPKFGGPEFIEESIKEQEKLVVPALKELGLYVGN